MDAWKCIQIIDCNPRAVGIIQPMVSRFCFPHYRATSRHVIGATSARFWPLPHSDTATCFAHSFATEMRGRFSTHLSGSRSCDAEKPVKFARARESRWLEAPGTWANEMPCSSQKYPEKCVILPVLNWLMHSLIKARRGKVTPGEPAAKDQYERALFKKFVS